MIQGENDCRMSPHSKDAQRALLGGCLRDNARIGEAIEALGGEPNAAADKLHGMDAIVFRAMAELYAAGKPADMVTVAEKLRDNGQLADVGGPAYIAELWLGAGSAANVAHYAGIVREKWGIRELAHLARESLGRIERDGAIPDEERERLETRLMRLAEADQQGRVYGAKEILRDTYAEIDAQSLGKRPALPTGLSDLDDILAGGQHPADLILGAGRPGQGKTSFALAIAKHAVTTQAAPVFFVSLEMSRVDLMKRLLCMEAEIEFHRVRRGILLGDTVSKLILAGDVLSSAPLFVDDFPTQTMARIISNARRLKQLEGLRLVICDYLQLIQAEDRKLPRHEQVGQISRQFKILARELDIPVLVLCQLNRELESRSDRRPRPSDLRESGSLEQDADCILLLHRPEAGADNTSNGKPAANDRPTAREGEAEIIVGKQRNGRTDTVIVRFDGPLMKFSDALPAELAVFNGRR